MGHEPSAAAGGPLRSTAWFGADGRPGMIYRTWMRAEGFTPEVFDGRPVIGIANSCILTTNFERLMERALEEAGVPPQVLANAGAVAGMTPLQHAPVTVIKLHGDYADLQMQNTIDELSSYPPELDRVLDEYGLVISGWSADWDKALVAAIERLKSRRYPLCWDSRSIKGETARRLLAQHGGVVTPAASADDFFSGLVDRVDALGRLTEPPLTTAVAIARLKRYLPDPSGASTWTTSSAMPSDRPSARLLRTPRTCPSLTGRSSTSAMLPCSPTSPRSCGFSPRASTTTRTGTTLASG